MYASVRALLSQILDYAGLFPPANLPLEDALRKYLRYRKGPAHRWMLGRFVCPTARLPDLLTLARAHEASPLHLTALGQKSSQASEILPQIETDIQGIREFRRSFGENAVIDMYEFALPKVAAVTQLAQLRLAAVQLEQAHLRGFLEVPFTPTWGDDVKDLCPVLHDLHGSSASGHLGLKLRCGGVTAEAFPSEAQVAFFIDRCRSANLPWKATAGLHHPRRHWDESVKRWHHGFLNVFGAGLLAQTNPLTEADIVEILLDREARHFRFEPERLTWKNWACSATRIAELRGGFATTFGSCSFEEPCADLVAMGLLDAEG